jgi:2-polyprenyl-3-methyl-5-hydroxy-6-metoxy-1,4-benzoquinol methylase
MIGIITRVSAAVGYVLLIVVAHLVLCVFGVGLFVFLHCAFSPLNDEYLASDLTTANNIYNINGLLSKTFTSMNVQNYYTETTDVDYTVLEKIMGPGMHTRIANNNALQFNYVVNEINISNATHVLEIGFGRGHSGLLAKMLPDVHFTAIDLVTRHVDVATGANKDIHNIVYTQGDATKDLSWLGHQKFDVIFGIESLCHMDSADHFIQQAKNLLTPGGKLVIVDGFRSRSFETANSNQQMAMMIAERGFQINQMHTTADWIRAADGSMNFTSFTDLTSEALPYWTLGWRVSSAILMFPGFVRGLYYWRILSIYSLWNLLAANMVAHAMRDGAAAQYGVLVLTSS